MASHEASGRFKNSIWWLVILACMPVMIWISRRGSLNSGGSNLSDADYTTLQSQINQLEVKKLIALGHPEDTTEIDRQLADLRPRLERLRPNHDAEMKRLAEEAKRKTEEAEQEKQRQYEREQAEFQKRCEATPSKRIADLTVNDLEVLRACRTNIEGLPQIH